MSYDEPSAAIHGGPNALVHFAIEDSGRLGAHAHAFVTILAIVALEKGRRTHFAYRAHVFFAPTLVLMASSRHLEACHEVFVS